MKKLIYWSPRILGILFVLFLSLFSLDVFTEDISGWDLILGVLIHLSPAIFLLIIVMISWKYDLVGTLVFIGFAIFYVIAAGFDRPYSWYLAISLPSTIVGILFYFSWLQKLKSKAV